MSTHDVGDRRKFSCTIKDENGDLIDPAVLVFKIRVGASTTTYTYGSDSELVKESTGVFHVYWDIATPGRHYWGFSASGNVGVVEETAFTARASNVFT